MARQRGVQATEARAVAVDECAALRERLREQAKSFASLEKEVAKWAAESREKDAATVHAKAELDAARTEIKSLRARLQEIELQTAVSQKALTDASQRVLTAERAADPGR